MAFLIIDMKRGGMDGFYLYLKDAERIAEFWKKELCHDQVLIVETKPGSAIEINEYCFLATRRIRGSLHGPEIPMHTEPPKEYWKQSAVNQCEEILRDLYASDYEQCDITARIEKLLASVKGRK